MTLKYALFENHLTSDPDDYMAVVQNLQSKSQDDVIDLMISRGSTATRAEALSVIEEYTLAIVLLLKDGYAINTPVFNLSPSVKGIFTSSDQAFNPAVHSVKINISVGSRLREAGRMVVVERVKGASPKPDPEYIDDLGSGTRNDQITPGNIAQVCGSRLKFDPAGESQGIFFIATNGTEVKARVIARNKPAQVDFLVPPLSPGEYRLEIRTTMGKNTEIRTGALVARLIVAGAAT